MKTIQDLKVESCSSGTGPVRDGTLPSQISVIERDEIVVSKSTDESSMKQTKQ